MTLDLAKFRPMKAPSQTPPPEVFQALPYPVLASPKLDGIRCVIHPTLGPVSNTLKPIANEWVRQFLSKSNISYLDGELIVGSPNHPNVYNATMSGIMSYDGTPDFTYYVFDDFEAAGMCGFGIRYGDAAFKHLKANSHRIVILDHKEISSYSELLEYETWCIEQGYEGCMVRTKQGKYKFGRATEKEGIFFKMKRYEDDEAVILDWEPLMRNNNQPVIDNLGLQKRNSVSANFVPDDTMVGRFYCRAITGRFKGVEFWCGSGLDDDQRTRFRQAIKNAEGATEWERKCINDPNDPIGKTFTFKHQSHGALDAPRTPIWKGLRDGNT